MLARLANTLACGFYKTKWTHHLPQRHPERKLQLPFTNWKIFNGDSVILRTGDDKGKVGRVVKVMRKLNRVVVRGLNTHFYTKKLEDGKTTRLKKASTIHISNVGLYDLSVKKAVRVLVGYHPDSGEVLRVSKKTGRVFYRSRKLLKAMKRQQRGKKRIIGMKDTPTSLAHKVTYSGQDFGTIRKQFEQFVAAKQARERMLVFKQ